MAVTLQTSFNAGYWNPKLQNRADVDLYRKAGSKIENFFIYPEGGLQKRDATEYLGEVIDSAHKSLLVPFQWSAEEVYVLEFSGNGTMRVMKLDAVGALTVVQSGFSTGLTDDELDDLQWCQVLRRIYFTHWNHNPMEFAKIDDTHFMWKRYYPYPAPQRTNQYTLGSYLWLSALSGNNVYFDFKDGDTSEANDTYELLPGDKGRYIAARGDKGQYGYGVILDIAGPDTNKEYYHSGYINIIEPFSAWTSPSTDYYLQGNGQSKMHPDNQEVGPEGKIIKIGAFMKGHDYLWRNPDDIGRTIELNKGFVQITDIIDHEWVHAVVIKPMDDGNETAYWQMGLPEWDGWSYGDLLTHPMTVNFYQNRLFFGGTIEKPGKIWGSRSMYLKDFTSNADDEYALEYLLSGNYLSEIKWMIGGAVLVVGTSNGIWTIGREDSSAVLTPSSPMLGLRSTIACSKIRPTSIGNWVFFVERNRTKMHVILGSANIDPAAAMPEDLTLLANPFDPQSNPIHQIVAQTNPNIVIWTIDDKGALWGMNYNQQQKIQSWFKYVTTTNQYQTDSYYENMMLYPQHDDIDRLWVVVKRYINGVWKRYIERFTLVAADCYKHNTYETATDTPNGFDHLIGEKVWVWNPDRATEKGNGWLRETDGTMALLTVDSNGAIDASTYGYTSTEWAVGLPYKAEAKTMDWYEGIQDTKYQKLKKISRLRVGVYNSVDGQVGVQVGNQDIKTAIPEEPIYVNIFETPPGINPDTNVEEFTGMIERSIDVPIGRDIKLCVRHANPEMFAITSLGCDVK